MNPSRQTCQLCPGGPARRYGRERISIAMEYDRLAEESERKGRLAPVASVLRQMIGDLNPIGTPLPGTQWNLSKWSFSKTCLPRPIPDCNSLAGRGGSAYPTVLGVDF